MSLRRMQVHGRRPMMEQSEPKSKPETPLAGEQSHRVQPVKTSDTNRDKPRSSPDVEPIQKMSLASSTDTPMPNAPGHQAAGTSGSSGAVQQPKVQTAFIHKLYSMLEDANIQHLISWSSSNESFVVSPTGEFSKVLSQYFKHTNISSFVRQLNMYGFHKVNDVFHTGSPDSALWEFKHGNGSFKRGDLVGLREIKRRASRQTLMNRDSFSGTKSAAVSAPGTPNEQPSEMETRLNYLEQGLSELHNRLRIQEDANAHLTSTLLKCHQWTSDLAQVVSRTLPPDSSLVRDVQSIQREIERHVRMDDNHDGGRQAFHAAVDPGVPLSPRQRPAEDDSRRSSLSGHLRPGYFRQPAPPHAAGGRRFGSVAMTGPSSPNTLRPQQLSHQPPQHPLATSHSPPSHLSRRHTSADIRQHGWQASSPFSGIGQTPHWPPPASPSKLSPEYREISYEMPQQPRPSIFASHTTPPLTEGTNNNESGWSFGNAKYPVREGHTAPPTRRSSLASSSVHALLNPPDSSTERDGMSDGEPEDRKRKRLV